MSPRAYESLIKKLTIAAERAGDREALAAIRLLDEARREIIAIIATTEWQIFYLPQQKKAIERALEDVARRLSIHLRDAQNRAWDRGAGMMDKILLEAGVRATLPVIDVSALGLMQTFGAGLVGGLGRDAAQKIVNELTLGLMGHKMPFEVIQAVGKNLKSPSIFKSIAARAETIVRTECGRALKAAAQLRLEKAGEVVPGLKKMWKHGGSAMPRPAHLAADGQIREANQPFKVGGEELMYPQDPAGSPGNTINCSCYSVPYKEEWQEAAKKAA